MAQIIHERDSADSATGIVAGVLIVLLVLALIWFFGLRSSNTPGIPATGEQSESDINVTVPDNAGGSTDTVGNTNSGGGPGLTY